MNSPKWSYLIHRIHRLQLIRRIHMRRELPDPKIQGQQMPMLEFVVEHNGCYQYEIADAMHITPASVACSTKRLAGAGIIEKVADESNLRCNRIFITEKGLLLTSEARKVANALDERMMAGFSQEEVNVFCSMLDRMIANISADDEKMLTISELHDKACCEIQTNGKDEKTKC